MKKMQTRIGLLAACVLLLAGAGFVYLTQPLSFTAGKIKIEGLDGVVRVARDAHGVPHIFSTTLPDAYAALGFLHASDRLFQMQMMRRAATGRLAEILGTDLLDYDKKMRVLGFEKLSRQNYDGLSSAVKGALIAYTRGVNAYLAAHKGLWPAEFRLLGFAPEKWDAPDCLLWAKMMAWQLSSNLDAEIFRATLLKNGISRDDVEKLFPAMDDGVPITTKPMMEQAPAPGSQTLLNRLPSDLHLSPSAPHQASNIYVMSGAHTLSGKPILANDPHLQLQAPVLWYLARLVTPQGEIKGATAPGMPFFPLGQNSHVAWGFTTTGSDVQDLLFIAPDNLQAHEEIIKVKGAVDVVFTVQQTKDGTPVLQRDDVTVLTPAGKVPVLLSTALQENDKTAEALYNMNQADNLDALLAATDDYKAPPQNLMAADDAGNIAFMAVGDVPLRALHDGFYPLEPLLQKAAPWVGMMPARPQLKNPENGILFNANNAVVDKENCAWPQCYLTREWAEPYRAMRLEALLRDAPKMDVAAAARPMLDVVSLPAQRLLPQLFAALPEDDKIRALKIWPGTMRADRAEPLIFHTWLQKLLPKVFGAAASAPLVWPRLWALEKMSLDKKIIEDSYHEALDDLTRRFGTDWRRWRWGAVHQAPLTNLLWSKVPLINQLTTVAVETDGDAYTLNRAAPQGFAQDQALLDEHGAGYRAVYDVGSPDASLFMIAGGQSGQIFTPHYGDLVPRWQAGEFITIEGTLADFEKSGASFLVLTPVAR